MSAMTLKVSDRTRPWFGCGGLRLGLCAVAASAWLCSPVSHSTEPAPPATASATTAAVSVQQRSYKTPEEAVEALVSAAEKFDVTALKEILGPDGVSLVVTGDPVLDRNQSKDFAAAARARSQIVRAPPNAKVATLNVGKDDWPMPIPIIEQHGMWRFDTAAGRMEVLYRRVGRNELDAIEACRNYVLAQNAYALHLHKGSYVNQYAQRIISTPGTQDGLVWRAADGTLQGPLASGLAKALAEGYTSRSEPYHGYFFKILKGQGPYAPLGQLDYVIEGAMIGGFALVAAPADYDVTGVKTFIVSQDGVVYESDLGPTTLDQFRALERFNPDLSWHPLARP